MLFLPNAALPPKHSTTGIARGRAASGHWLRSKTIPLNPRSNAQPTAYRKGGGYPGMYLDAYHPTDLAVSSFSAGTF
jgi:hypothetical protein